VTELDYINDRLNKILTQLDYISDTTWIH